jgi:hypothetical protein
MSATSTILGKLLEPVTDCFSVEMARKLLAVKADSSTEARLEVLRTKANEGDLSESERKEYQAYVDAINLIGILQAKARRIVAQD